MLSESNPGRIPFLRRILDQLFPRIQAALFGDGAEHLREQIHDRLHVAQRRVRAAFGQAIILPQRLQLAVAGGHGIEKPLRQPQSAESLAADGSHAKPLPLRLQHFIQIVFQIEGNQRQVARVFGKLPIDLQRRLTVALQNLPRVAVNARGFGGNVRVLIQQLAERFAVGCQPRIRCAASSTTNTGADKPVVSVSSRSQFAVFIQSILRGASKPLDERS